MLLRKYLMGTPSHGGSAKESRLKRTWIVLYKVTLIWCNLTNVVIASYIHGYTSCVCMFGVARCMCT